MARRLLVGGLRAVSRDLSVESVAAASIAGATGPAGFAALVGALAAPRTVWVMAPSGEPTESVVAEHSQPFSPGDLRHRRRELELQGLAALGGPARGRPVRGCRPFVADQGARLWTVVESIEKAVPTPTTTAASQAPFRSRQKDARGACSLNALRSGPGGARRSRSKEYWDLGSRLESIMETRASIGLKRLCGSGAPRRASSRQMRGLRRSRPSSAQISSSHSDPASWEEY